MNSDTISIVRSYENDEPESYWFLPSGHADTWIVVCESPSNVYHRVMTTSEVSEQYGIDPFVG